MARRRSHYRGGGPRRRAEARARAAAKQREAAARLWWQGPTPWHEALTAIGAAVDQFGGRLAAALDEARPHLMALMAAAERGRAAQVRE